jgi:hypothetical protein
MRATRAAATSDIADADDFARTALSRHNADDAASGGAEPEWGMDGTTTGIAGVGL